MSDQSLHGGLLIEVCPEWDKRNKARMALPWSSTFDELAAVILHELGWDDEHLYEFCLIRGGSTFRQQMLRSLKILCPEVDGWDGDELRTEISLADVSQHLKPKAALYFHFDFGDNHYFRIIVKGHFETLESCEVIKLFPKSIAQYPDWDEGDDSDW